MCINIYTHLFTMDTFEIKVTIACQPFKPQHSSVTKCTDEVLFKFNSLGHSTYNISLTTSSDYNTYTSRYYEKYVHCTDNHAESSGFTNALLSLDLENYDAFKKYFVNVLIDNPLDVHIEKSTSNCKHAQLSVSHNSNAFTLFFD